MARPLILGIPNVDKDMSIKYSTTFGNECLLVLRGKRGKPNSFETISREPTYKEKIIYFNMENKYEGMRDLVEYDQRVVKSLFN